MAIEELKHWTELLQPTKLYGIEVEYGSGIKDGTRTFNLPNFPWENQNHKLGSLLLMGLPGNLEKYTLGP